MFHESVHIKICLTDLVEKVEKENIEMVNLFLLIDDNIRFIKLQWKGLEKIGKIIAPI